MANEPRPYLVLVNDGDSWVEVGTFMADRHQNAIRQAVAEKGFGPEYIAVAASAWHSETPKPDPRTRIVWS